MARRTITKRWAEQDIAKLIELHDSGATLIRASAALNRSQPSVQRMAGRLNRTFPGVRKVRARLVASGALEPRRR